MWLSSSGNKSSGFSLFFLKWVMINSVGMEMNTSESRVCLHPSPAVDTISLQKVRHLIHMSQGNPDVIWLSLNLRVIACSCMSLFFTMMVWHLNYVLYHIKLTLHVWTGDDYITPEGTVFYNDIDSCLFVCVCACAHPHKYALAATRSISLITHQSC